jgi:two-component system, cell cycle response regulator
MKIAIFCGQPHFARLISTVVVRLNQTGKAFDLVPTSDTTAVVGIVDAADAADCAMAARALKAQPGLKLVNVVGFTGQALGVNEVLRSNVVIGLMPTIKKIADAKAVAELAAQVAAKEVALTATPRPAVQVPTKRVLRALAVDDSPTIRAQLQNILGRIGMECDIAESAIAALKKLETNSYDIMYVDVVMPEMNGYELTRAVKRDRARKAMPVIILTSQSSPFDRARGALAGCDTYLSKPVDAKRFFDATVKALSKMSGHDMDTIHMVDPATRSSASSTPVQAPPNSNGGPMQAGSMFRSA